MSQVFKNKLQSGSKVERILTWDEPVLDSAVIRWIDIVAAIVGLRGLVVGVRILVEAGNKQPNVEKVGLNWIARLKPVIGRQSDYVTYDGGQDEYDGKKKNTSQCEGLHFAG